MDVGGALCDQAKCRDAVAVRGALPWWFMLCASQETPFLAPGARISGADPTEHSGAPGGTRLTAMQEAGALFPVESGNVCSSTATPGPETSSL